MLSVSVLYHYCFTLLQFISFGCGLRNNCRTECLTTSGGFFFFPLNLYYCYQVGIPPDREQYIHRLGRTGREGKDGKGILLLAPWEEYFIDEIKDLPTEKTKLPELNSDIKQKVCFINHFLNST